MQYQKSRNLTLKIMFGTRCIQRFYWLSLLLKTEWVLLSVNDSRKMAAENLPLCTEELMKTTKDGKALYLHCLPADINDVSCKDGEVEATVFDRYRDPLYKEASYKPYVIAAMIMLAKFADPADVLKRLEEKGTPRVFK